MDTARIEHRRLLIRSLHILGDFYQYDIATFKSSSNLDNLDEIGKLFFYGIEKVETLLIRLILIFHDYFSFFV